MFQRFIFLKVVAEAKKSYEKLATLRKEFGHSGSYKSEDGTLYIGEKLISFFWVGGFQLDRFPA